ncbi:methyltransferase [Aliikangiella sp. IMCC44632]
MHFIENFKQLDELLTSTRSWWQFAPFHKSKSRWAIQSPQLHRLLESAKVGYAPLNQVSENELLERVFTIIPELKVIKNLANLPQRLNPIEPPTAHWQFKISDRKWQQIAHFAGLVPLRQQIVDWCSGKGHLGRLVAAQGAESLTSIEWRKDLCASCQVLNKRLKIAEEFCSTKVIERDVLSGLVDTDLNQTHFAVALHACGDLHSHLVELVARKQLAGLCLSPCCYNLIAEPFYQPLSSQAQHSELKLSKLDLSLTLRQLVTAGKRERSEQEKEKLWRLAFDSWQREVLQSNTYMPLPTIPKNILKGHFKSFIIWAARVKQSNDLLSATEKIDETKVIAMATERLPQVIQMEWVQAQFQRALEVWLLLDKAIFLQDQGYQCELFEFCEVKLTPRNIMLKAVKKTN